MLRQAEGLIVAIEIDRDSWFRDWRTLMKANLLKRVIPAVLIIAGLTAGTSLLAGYIDRPTQAPQAAVDAKCDGCPLLDTDACCKVTGVCANPQTCTTPCIGTPAHAAPAPGAAANDAVCAAMAATAAPCAGMAAGTTPCAGGEGCPMPCCQKTGETPAAGCTIAKPQTTGCPFLDSSSQAVSPCGAGGCTGEK